MPYLGRAPAEIGTIANVIEGDLKVKGTISGESINDKFAFDTAADLDDHFVIEDGGTDGSGTNAGDNMLLEDTTEGLAESVELSAITDRAGTSGQLLTSAGAFSSPTFTTVSGGGSAVLARVAFSAVSAVSITAFDNANFDAYKIFWEITPGTDGVDIIYKTSTDAGSSYDGGSGNYYWRHFINDPGIEDFNVTSAADARISRGNSNGGFLSSAGTGEHTTGELTIIAPDNTGYTHFSGIHTGVHNNGLLMYSYLHAMRLSAADVDAIQISPSSGNVTGRYVLLGIRNST